MTAEQRHLVKTAIDSRRRELAGRPPQPGQYAHLMPEQSVGRFAHIPREQWGNRQHGTEVMYVHGGCKCLPCRAAHARARRMRLIRRSACVRGCGRPSHRGPVCRFCRAREAAA